MEQAALMKKFYVTKQARLKQHNPTTKNCKMTLLQITQATGLTELSFSFLTRFAINAISAFILIRYIYFPIHKNRENVFLFSIFSLLIFIISYLLNSVDIGMGSAFGLFAVFSILQYRTVKISTKDMTYMFLLIAMGLIDAVSITTWPVLAVLSAVLLGITYLLESSVLLKRESTQTVTYANLNLIRPDERHNLIADLEFRLGVKITHLSIREIDFEKQHALIQICYVYTRNEKSVNGRDQDRPQLVNGTSNGNGYTVVEQPKQWKEHMRSDTVRHKTKGKNREKNLTHVVEELFDNRDKKTGKKNNGHLSLPNNFNS